MKNGCVQIVLSRVKFFCGLNSDETEILQIQLLIKYEVRARRGEIVD